ncbi:envelope biogenesis factor ElyC [Aeromonas cavernicola]|uniref:Envelope biogenesis factor ElyC n=1 Tax=Aeromonas cavernicola TaxID=1006623 RepID=A0A2H9U9R0_9GAMM|nr:envelope biogenesis factor ElyC [Aeromonas cavernicola]PJG60763.1 envelope biogenesis factor ElyC [Aeromonas cavernicola]
MNNLFVIKKWLGQLLMPLPFALCVLLLALVLLWFTRFQKTGKLLATLALIMVTLMGMRPVSYQLARDLEQRYPPFEISQHPDIEAIVVLGNGHVSDPALPERAWQNNVALARTLEGVRLAQAYPNAELIFSGAVIGDALSNAEVNARMAQSLGIPRTRMTLFENNKDTHDEAVSISGYLKGKTVALVSSATHLPRAMALYQQQGLNAVAAPTDYTAKQSLVAQPLYSYLPKGRYLMYSEAAIHEWLGVTWARLRGQVND